MSKAMTQQISVYTHYEFNFDAVIRNEKARSLFVKHLTSEFNAELFEFCVQVELYMEAPTKSFAKDIFNKFIKEMSKHEINIHQALRRQVEYDIELLPEDDLVNGKVVESLLHIFDMCYDQVRMSLYNSFGRFKRSKDFINFAQKQSDAYLRTIGTHKSDLQSCVLQVENFTTPSIISSDLLFARELTQDWYYWTPIYNNKSIAMTLFNGYGAHKFISDEVVKITGNMVAMKTEFNVQQNVKRTLMGLFSEKYRSKALGLNKMELLEYKPQQRPLPTAIFQGKLFVGSIFQYRDVVCAISAIYDRSTKSYIVIVRSCEHAKSKSADLLGHYYWIYKLHDLGATTCKIQMVALANSHGAMEAQKPSKFYDFVLKLGAPELCNKQAKNVLKLEKDDCEKFEDDSFIERILQDTVSVLATPRTPATPATPSSPALHVAPSVLEESGNSTPATPRGM